MNHPVGKPRFYAISLAHHIFGDENQRGEVADDDSPRSPPPTAPKSTTTMPLQGRWLLTDARLTELGHVWAPVTTRWLPWRASKAEAATVSRLHPAPACDSEMKKRKSKYLLYFLVRSSTTSTVW